MEKNDETQLPKDPNSYSKPGKYVHRILIKCIFNILYILQKDTGGINLCTFMKN